MSSLHGESELQYLVHVRTGGLIGSEDAFSWSHYLLSDFLQLLLLLGSQRWVLVSHGGWKRAQHSFMVCFMMTGAGVIVWSCYCLQHAYVAGA